MTDSRCWIGYKNDRALQKKIDDGWFTENEEQVLPIDNFPPHSFNGSYWPGLVSGWATKRGIKCKRTDSLTVSARVTKEQIEDFIQDIYLSDANYIDPKKMITWKGRAYLANSLTDLRAFVSQQLDPALLYELKGDEF